MRGSFLKIKFFIVLFLYFGHAFSHPHLGEEDMEYFEKYISGEFAKRGFDNTVRDNSGLYKVILGTFLSLMGLVFFRRKLMDIVTKDASDVISSEHMKVLNVMPIGFQKSLKLVQVGKEFLLLSVSQMQVSLICKIEDPEMIDNFKLESSFRQGEGLEKVSFLNWWTRKEDWKNSKEMLANIK